MTKYEDVATRLANAESALARLTKLGHHNSAKAVRNEVAALRREMAAYKRERNRAAAKKKYTPFGRLA